MVSYYSIAQWGVTWLPEGLAVQAIGKRHQDEETDGPPFTEYFPRQRDDSKSVHLMTNAVKQNKL